MKAMADAARDLDRRFSYGDYRSWEDGERWELIEGQAWSMSPAPRTDHQALSLWLASAIHAFLKGKPCRVFAAPFDVLLPTGDEADDDVDSVVQPDIAVFCDRSKLREAGARGAPDFVVEILSPSTAKKDLSEKFRLYETRGVREYWIVDPGNRSVLAFRLKAPGTFDSGELRDMVSDASPIASEVLVGFAVDPKALFAEMD
jgi:Uma2 family endonuclease